MVDFHPSLRHSSVRSFVEEEDVEVSLDISAPGCLSHPFIDVARRKCMNVLRLDPVVLGPFGERFDEIRKLESFIFPRIFARCPLSRTGCL